jgi:hypothetical protein
LQSTNAEVLFMTSTPEWLPQTTIRRRLWACAKHDRADIETALLVRKLIPDLVTAHVRNWYGDKIQVDSEGVAIIEWTPLLKFVCKNRPDIWPPAEIAPAEISKPRAKARKRPSLELDRVKTAMRADIKRGKHTAATLNANDEALASDYKTSRSTARRAREEILPELVKDEDEAGKGIISR